MKKYEKICVVGLGYIGLPTAAMFASRNLKVVGVDVNKHAVETINRGDIHIVEPDLDQVVRHVVDNGYLVASLEPEDADAFIIAVPTPFKGEDHQPDLSYIETASKNIAKYLKKGALVVLESTSPVGATEKMADWLASERPDLSFPQNNGENSDIRIAHCPERVLPGKVMQELISNDRIIGGITKQCSYDATDLYKIFVEGNCQIASSARIAEMCKLTENSFRDVNIAFANELSLICARLEMDVWELIKLANLHPRVNILQPGPGVGGHCIAVDPWFIVSSARHEAQLIAKAREVNDAKPSWVLSQINEAKRSYIANSVGLDERNLKIALYGVAFKPDIDDLRESPALMIAEKLINEYDGEVLIVEPNIDILPTELIGSALVDISFAEANAHIHVYLVAHKEFKSRPPIKSNFLVDCVGLYSS